MDRDPKLKEPVRLSKLMSERGLCSRREADALIEQGLVFVNGERVSQLGIRFPPDVEIELDPQARQTQRGFATIMLNKPVGYVSMLRDEKYPSAYELLTEPNLMKGQEELFRRKHFNDLSIIGRLDIDSHGLLLFTQDGRIAKQVIGPDSNTEKEYLVRTEERISDDQIKLLSYGLELEGEKLKRAQVEQLDETFMKIVLTQGKHRQIRRMCELVDLHVTGLKRVRIANLKLGSLPRGQWRYVEPGEVVPGL
ncbi:MAG: pseudouridine synthase [Bdellovibrionota bacterium]